MKLSIRQKLGFAACLLVCSFSWAGIPTEWGILIFGRFGYHYSYSDADRVAGAFYTQTYSRPIAGEAGVGVRTMGNIYFQMGYEYWIANRAYAVSNVPFSDVLHYQALGVEAGYLFGSPRAFLILAGGVQYPLELGVTDSAGVAYATLLTPLSYRGRLVIGVRMNDTFTLLMDGGYRVLNFGSLESNGTPLLSGGAAFDLSGLFLGAGLGVTL